MTDQAEAGEKINEWGMGEKTMQLFLAQSTDFFNAMSANKEMRDVIDISTRPDHDLHYTQNNVLQLLFKLLMPVVATHERCALVGMASRAS